MLVYFARHCVPNHKIKKKKEKKKKGRERAQKLEHVERSQNSRDVQSRARDHCRNGATTERADPRDCTGRLSAALRCGLIPQYFISPLFFFPWFLSFFKKVKFRSTTSLKKFSIEYLNWERENSEVHYGWCPSAHSRLLRLLEKEGKKNLHVAFLPSLAWRNFVGMGRLGSTGDSLPAAACDNTVGTAARSTYRRPVPVVGRPEDFEVSPSYSRLEWRQYLGWCAVSDSNWCWSSRIDMAWYAAQWECDVHSFIWKCFGKSTKKEMAVPKYTKKKSCVTKQWMQFISRHGSLLVLCDCFRHKKRIMCWNDIPVAHCW